MDSLSIEKLRDFLPAAKQYRFFNYAATAPLLTPSAEVMIELVRQAQEPLSKHFDPWLARVESARSIVGKLINASSDEITFTTNTSTGLSLIANAVEWEAGDRVLYPADEFPSNRFVWDNLKRKGVSAEAIIVDPFKGLGETLRTLNLDRVRLLAVSAVAYTDGRREDIKAVTEMCHKRGILVAVDGIQAVGAVPLDVKKIGCDFLACGGQKWLLGPVGSGFLFIRRDLLEKLFMPLVGWASSRHAGEFDVRRLEFVDGARRLEPGLVDVPAIAGLACSIEVLTSFGWSSIYEKVRANDVQLRNQLAALGREPLAQQEGASSGIITLPLADEREASFIRQAFEKERILATLVKRNGQFFLRLASHVPVSSEDIGALIETIKHCPSSVSRVTVVKSSREKQIENDSSPRARKRALVTGASRGLGFALARGLAARGFDLMLIARDKEKLQEIASQLSDDGGVRVEVVDLDLTHPEVVESWLNDQQSTLNFDLVINNAAMAEAGLFAEADVRQWRDMMEVNFFSPVIITRKILPGMLDRREGRVLNIVTSGARCSLPLFSGYSASKGALWAWSESLAREMYPGPVTITTFVPRHMESVTQRVLGRKALGYYKMSEHANLVSADKMAEEALEALFRGQAVVVPWEVRWRQAINALCPGWVSGQINRTRRSGR